MVIDKEEGLDLLTARFDNVIAVPKLSKQERMAETHPSGPSKGHYYHIKDKMGSQSYELLIRLSELRSGDQNLEFGVSTNEPLYHRLDLDLPSEELRSYMQVLLDSMNRILLRPAV